MGANRKRATSIEKIPSFQGVTWTFDHELLSKEKRRESTVIARKRETIPRDDLDTSWVYGLEHTPIANERSHPPYTVDRKMKRTPERFLKR